MPGDAEPILSVRGLSVGFRGVPAVRDVSFDITPGEIVGLTGDSGSGKSTLGLALLGLVRQPGRILGGSVMIEGIDLLQLPEAEKRARRGRQIGLIVQNPRGSLSPLHTVGSQIRSVLHAHLKLPSVQAASRAVGLLRQLGLNDPERRAGSYPHEISGGMAQRVLIAMATGAGPRILVADEPTSGLDVTIQAQFLDELAQTSQAAGSAVLLITQDLGIIANYCDRVLVMHDGHIVASDSTAAFFAAPKENYGQTLLSLAHAPPPPPPVDPAELLAVRALSKHFHVRGSGKRLQAVDRVDLTIGRGETLGLVGESGSGKTTVGRCVLRLLDADAGEVVFEGKDLLRAAPRDLRTTRRRIQIVFQDPLDALDPRWSVSKILSEALVRPNPDRIAELLTLVGLDPATASLRPRGLSAGAQQRVGIARAIAADPALIVLDEPTSALAPMARVGIVALLRELQARLGMSYLFISHDLNTVEQLSHRVAVMYLGQIVELGTREQVFHAPRHPYAKALLAAHLAPDPTRRRVDSVQTAALAGEIPSPIDLPPGCYLAGRCPVATASCHTTPQPLYTFADAGKVRCTPAAVHAGLIQIPDEPLDRVHQPRPGAGASPLFVDSGHGCRAHR
jgi:oligopeptide/dipeptide ABC transporter ATP-binding protein